MELEFLKLTQEVNSLILWLQIQLKENKPSDKKQKMK